MARKKFLTKKEKLYALSGVVALIIIVLVIGLFVYNNLFGGDKKSEGRIQLKLQEEKIVSGEKTKLTITITNKGKDVLEGDLIVRADDENAVNITHVDPSVLNVKLYEGESITRILNVEGKTSAIRTDYKIIAEILKENKTLTSNELILTVTRN